MCTIFLFEETYGHASNFKKNEAKDLPFSEEILECYEPNMIKAKAMIQIKMSTRSRGIMLPNAFASANTHKDISFFYP
jgi:hypothetical protein